MPVPYWQCTASTSNHPLTWPLGLLVFLDNVVQKELIARYHLFYHHVKGDLLWETAGFLSHFWNSSFCSPNFPCKLSKNLLKMNMIPVVLLLSSDLSAAICKITFVIALDNYFIVTNSAFSQIWNNSSLVHLHFDTKATECMAFYKNFQIKFDSSQLFFAVCFKYGFIVMDEGYC